MAQLLKLMMRKSAMKPRMSIEMVDANSYRWTNNLNSVMATSLFRKDSSNANMYIVSVSDILRLVYTLRIAMGSMLEIVRIL